MKPQDKPSFCRWKLKPNEISDIIIQTSYQFEVILYMIRV